MNPTTWMSVGAFACAAIQAAVAIVSLYDRHRLKVMEGAKCSAKRLLILAIVAVIGIIVASILGTALLMYHPKLNVVEKKVIEEKPIPCPIARQKSGPATAHAGRDAFAHSGNGDKLNSAPPTPQPVKSPH